ncbi:MAG: hypothetical protein ACJ8F3_21750 [Xanthobacteraceae bacterium]
MKRIGSGLVFLLAVVAVVVTSVSAVLAQATYPSRPIRIVVGFVAGGPSDIISRTVGANM